MPSQPVARLRSVDAVGSPLAGRALTPNNPAPSNSVDNQSRFSSEHGQFLPVGTQHGRWLRMGRTIELPGRSDNRGHTRIGVPHERHAGQRSSLLQQPLIGKLRVSLWAIVSGVRSTIRLRDPDAPRRLASEVPHVGPGLVRHR